MLKEAKFELDAVPGVWPGWMDGRSWNGWAAPHFTREQADRFVAAWNAQHEGAGEASYDSSIDAYRFKLDEWEEPEYFYGKTIEGRRFYPVGARSWTWSQVLEGEAALRRDLLVLAKLALLAAANPEHLCSLALYARSVIDSLTAESESL